MRIFSNYIARAVLRPTAMVLMLLVGMTALFDFLGELDEVGHYDYTVRKALLYVLLYLPTRMVQMFPASTLIGTVMGLGVLSSSSELTVMRAAGVSPIRIGLATLRAATLLIVVGGILSEFVAPEAAQLAEVMRTNALSPNQFWVSGASGTWLRSGSDFVNVARIIDDRHVEDVRIFHINTDQQLAGLISADKANYGSDGIWHLHQGTNNEYGNGRVQTSTFTDIDWRSELKPENLATLQINPTEMTGRSLFFYVEYLVRNGLDWRRYDLEFWRKVVQPLNLFAMVLAGIASVFGPLRSVTVSARILTGVAVGLGFQFMTQLFGPISLVSEMPPLLGALLPPLVLLSAAIWLLRKAR